MTQWLLVGILMAGFVLRIVGLGFGLPNEYCRPDETTLVYKALGIAAAGDPNPHFFNYPSLHFYLLTFLYVLYLGCGLLSGRFVDIASFQAEFFSDPSNFYLIGRFVTVCFGTGSIYWVWLLGIKMGGKRVGLLGALFFSAAFLHVRDSHFLTVDVPALFYAMGALVFALGYMEKSKKSNLVLSGVLMGCAISTKYNLLLLGGASVLSLVLGADRQNKTFPWKSLFCWGTVVCGVFVLGSPFVLADFSNAWRDISFERAHFAQGHGLDLGRGWGYHSRFTLPLGLGWPLFLTALAGIIWLVWRRKSADWIILCAIVSYFGVAGSGKAVFVRYMLPLIPLLCLAAAAGIGHWTRRWPLGAVILLGAVVVYPSAVSSFDYSRLLAQKDTRVLAAEWIEAHIPASSRLALHGTDFGFPRIRPDHAWIRERYEDMQSAGLPGQRLLYQLRNPSSPEKPSYYTVELKEENASGFRNVMPYFTRQALLKSELRWIVLVEHPLARQFHPGLWAELQREGVLVAQFDPFISAAEEKLTFDPLDAFYLPLTGFSRVSRPGPKIYIYHLAHDLP
jgi:hypothetical protein